MCYSFNRHVFTLLLGIFISGTFCAQPAYAQDLVSPDAKPEKIADGHQFTEGPYWHEDSYLLFSDIPANTIFRWTPGDDKAEPYVNPSGHSNGIASGQNGNILLAQHDGMVSLLTSDKTFDPIVKSYEGKRLNSPNDLTSASDGSIYFTDPPYGVSDEDRELEIYGVYRVTSHGELELLYDALSRPNGIVFSPDQKILYVNDTVSGRILSFEIGDDGNVSLPTEFASVGKADDTGAADGMAVDKDGNLYSTGPGGIHVFSPEGTLLQKIGLTERATNLTWGDEKLNTLFITSPSGVYRLVTNTTGIRK